MLLLPHHWEVQMVLVFRLTAYRRNRGGKRRAWLAFSMLRFTGEEFSGA